MNVFNFPQLCQHYCNSCSIIISFLGINSIILFQISLSTTVTSIYSNYQFLPFCRCCTLSKRYQHEHKALHIPVFYMKIDNFNNGIHRTRDKQQRFQSLSSSFSSTLVLSGPGSASGPVFSQCHRKLDNLVKVANWVSLKFKV